MSTDLVNLAELMSFEKRLKEIQRCADLEAFGDRPARVLALGTEAIGVMDESPEDFEIPSLGVVWWNVIRCELEGIIRDLDHVVGRLEDECDGSDRQS